MEFIRTSQFIVGQTCTVPELPYPNKQCQIVNVFHHKLTGENVFLVKSKDEQAVNQTFGGGFHQVKESQISF